MYDDIDNLQNQRNQLYDEAMRQQENMINLGTQQTIDEIERNKEKAAKEAEKTNRALYTDYQKQINPYGVNAEYLAEQGLGKSGLAESTRANYYNTYQNARTEATNNANTIKADFDAEIARARQNGDLQKAQAAQNMYMQKINDLATMYNLRFQADQFSYQKEQDALAQSNWQKEYERALQQQQWQQAFNQNQFDYQKDRDIIADNQWNQQFNYQQGRDAVADNQWNQQFGFTQDQFNYQKERDKVADSQWEKEYQLSKKNSTASRSSGSSGNKGGNTGTTDDSPKGKYTAEQVISNMKMLQGVGTKDKPYTAVIDGISGKQFDSPEALFKYYDI